MPKSSENQGINFAIDDNSRKLILEQKKIGQGYLGRFFGDKESAPTNISGMVLLLLVISMILLCIIPSHISPLEYINSVLPIIGIIIGYFFGKRF